MKLTELIKIADSGYPDHLVQSCFDGEEVYDSIAKFIAYELKDTYDEDATTKQQLNTAIDNIIMAIGELEDVLTQLESARDIEEDNETDEGDDE